MRYKQKFAWLAAALLLLGQAAVAQVTDSGTTNISVNVGAEASLSIGAASTALTTSGTTFSNDYVGTTNFTYKIRTSKTGGTGLVTLSVITDFPAGGPSVRNPPTADDKLSYTCSVTGPGSGCSSAQTAAFNSGTPVASFGADAKSAKAGDSGSVSWSLSNDPLYSTGSYTATVQFTISAT